MTKIKQQRYHHELLSIALIGNLWQNTHTTKRKAVKPSRHSLAIFTLTVSDNSATGVNISSLQDTDSITSYGGLIGVNTRPKGNSPSHLGMVVETCHPIFGWRKLTKFQGNPQMNHLLFTLTRLSPPIFCHWCCHGVFYHWRYFHCHCDCACYCRGCTMKQDKLISALSNIESAKSIMEDLNNIFGILREADPKEIECIRSLTFVMWKELETACQYLNDGYKVLDDEYSKGAFR